MSHKSKQFSEHFLQHLWNEHFFWNELSTSNGKKVRIIDPGTLNKSDGPDFLNAKIQIDGLFLYGAIELHLKCQDWYNHNHHSDSNYDSVIFHISADEEAFDVANSKGIKIPTASVVNYLPDEMKMLANETPFNTDLSCSGIVKYISPEVFEHQIQKSHLEYLAKKKNDFLNHYPTGLGLAEAWKEALIKSVFSSYGIPHNREAMILFAEQHVIGLTEKENKIELNENINQAIKTSDINWNFKGVRPNHHPNKRIFTALQLSIALINHFEELTINDQLNKVWINILKSAGIKNTGFGKLLFGLVFLPAMGVLADLIHNKRLSAAVIQSWNELKSPVPEKFVRFFTPIPQYKELKLHKKLGVVHQVNAYCKQQRCMDCGVLKKVISS